MKKRGRRQKKTPKGRAPAAVAVPAAGEALVLADIPERVRLRELTAAIESRRDAIAELDLSIESLRDELANFEAAYQIKLANENAELRRVQGLVQHVWRWTELLAAARKAADERQRIDQRAAKIEGRRTQHLRAQKEQAACPPDPRGALALEPRPPDSRLKDAYRALARRYHPDLARTEQEQVKFGQMMARINALYHAGDVERLASLAEQEKGAELDDLEMSLAEQLDYLQQRLEWFGAVMQNLEDERAALERSPTCELMRNVAQARQVDRDLFAEIRADLAMRVKKSYNEVRQAIELLETEVSRYNREATSSALIVAHKGDTALARRFDPYADKKLIRVGLEQVAVSRASQAGRDCGQWLESVAGDKPALLRLILLTHVVELSPFPLSGIESYDDLEERFIYLGRQDAVVKSLEETLVEADDLVEFGVRQASASVVHLGLHFRSAGMREGVALALQSLSIRRELKRVLGVLDERVQCPACKEEVYAVPLYRTRGLDNLRASVCPACGETLKSYWMPRGKDVQAVLNPAFIDFEIVTEWSFALSRASVAIQLLPLQVESMTVGDLRERLVSDFFDRYELGLTARQVDLLQGGQRVPVKTPLDEIETRHFEVRFGKDAKLNEADALETLQHRVRQRFHTD